MTIHVCFRDREMMLHYFGTNVAHCDVYTYTYTFISQPERKKKTRKKK